jgi:hypothetical protein
MVRTLMLVSALALSSGAIAQDQMAPADAQAAPEAAAPAEAAPADATAAAQPAAAPAADVAAVVAAEFPAYDGDADGQLTKDEFSKWLITLRTKSEPNADAAEMQTWAGTAFAQADTDKSTSISQDELTRFLQG